MQQSKYNNNHIDHNMISYIESFLVAIISFICEYALVFLLPIFDYIMAHLLLSLILFLWVYLRRNMEHYSLRLIFVITFIFSGIFSIAVFAIVFLALIFTKQKTFSVEQWFNALMPDDKKENDEYTTYETIELITKDINDNVEPFYDILEYGSIEQKSDVVTKITKYFKPIFAPILLKALNSKENSIRVQAASTMAKMENDFTKKYVLFQKKVKEHGYQNLDELIEFGKFCDDYSYCGILDEKRKKESILTAIEMYECYYNINPNHHEINFLLGRIYLRYGDSKKSVTFFKRCFNLAPSSYKYLYYYMNALFQSQNFHDLRILIKQYDDANRITRDYSYSYRDMTYKIILLWNKFSDTKLNKQAQI